MAATLRSGHQKRVCSTTTCSLENSSVESLGNSLFTHISIGFQGCIQNARVLEISGIHELADNKHIPKSLKMGQCLLAIVSTKTKKVPFFEVFFMRQNLLRYERKFNKKISAMRSGVIKAR